jgi:hypothetical protein
MNFESYTNPLLTLTTAKNALLDQGDSQLATALETCCGSLLHSFTEEVRRLAASSNRQPFESIRELRLACDELLSQLTQPHNFAPGCCPPPFYDRQDEAEASTNMAHFFFDLCESYEASEQAAAKAQPISEEIEAEHAEELCRAAGIEIKVAKRAGEWAAIYYVERRMDEGKTYYAGGDDSEAKADAEGTRLAMLARDAKRLTSELIEGDSLGEPDRCCDCLFEQMQAPMDEAGRCADCAEVAAKALRAKQLDDCHALTHYASEEMLLHGGPAPRIENLPFFNPKYLAECKQRRADAILLGEKGGQA